MLLSTLLMMSCKQEQTFHRRNEVEAEIEFAGSVSGRVCDPSGYEWIEGALVYANLVDGSGRFYDVLTTFTDADGRWYLEDLPQGYNISIQIQHEGVLIEEHTIDVEDDKPIRLDEPDCFDPQEVSIAVVTGDYDAFDTALEQLGIFTYTIIDGQEGNELETFLTDLQSMEQYDLIYFNGGCLEAGILYDAEDPHNTAPDTILANLQTYVANGGNVYASDWAYDVVEQAWPDKIDFLGVDHVPDDAQLGSSQAVDASIANAAMANFIGDEDGKMLVTYDLPVWPPIETATHTVSVHLLGNVDYRDNGIDQHLASSPLLVSFNGGGGKVVFSTFRLAANLNEGMLTMMKYLLFEL